MEALVKAGLGAIDKAKADRVTCFFTATKWHLPLMEALVKAGAAVDQALSLFTLGARGVIARKA